VTRNLTFWADESRAAAAGDVPSRSVSRCWCDPLSFSDVVGLDFGSGRMHLYSATHGRSWSVDASSAKSEILSLASGTLLLAESAHLATPRTKKSLAQPFSDDELLYIYRTAASLGITIKLFPHYHSGTRARAWAAVRFPEIQSEKKTDAADAMALALYVMNCNAVSLANPPASFAVHPRRKYGMSVRQYSSITLNAERTTGYTGRHMPFVIQLGDEIFRRRGKRIGRVACYSIASLIATEIDGDPRMFVSNGRAPGVDFWWKTVAMMTPFHHRAGIARSNLMRHAFRPFLRKFGQRENVMMGTKNKIDLFGTHSEEQADIRTQAMQSFRDIAKDCYRDGIKAAVSLGFGEIDPVATPCSEAINGR